MKVVLLKEPELQFGTGTHIDVRFGLMNYGLLDGQSCTARDKIRVGVVGDAASIDGIRGWLARARSGIPGKETNKPNLYPAFPGFGPGRACSTDLIFDHAMEQTLSPNEIKRLCRIADHDQRTVEAATVIGCELHYLSEKGSVDVLICAVPADLLDSLDPPNVDDPDEVAAENQPGDIVATNTIDFHHLLKAKTMHFGPPVQLVLPATYDPSKRRRQKRRAERLRGLQDEATRAWNFYVALYYKAGGIPWRLIRKPTQLESCFVGISFYESLDKQSLTTSVAQIFDERGVGVIVRGTNVAISKDDRQPHLDEAQACSLLEKALDRYRLEHRHLPARIVVHKTSSFTDQEVAGFSAATQSRGVDSHDLMNVQQSGIRLFRKGIYPTLRGTLLSLSDVKHVLYVRGSVEFFSTYPGLYVPRPLLLDCRDVAQTGRFLADEVLALTKMNWNNTQFDGGMPITVRAARQVGKLLRYVEPDAVVQSRYSYYM